MDLEICASKRFLSAYHDSASLGLKDKAEGVIHDFVRRYYSDPRKILHSYGKLAGRRETVIELKPTGGHRLLVDFSHNCLTLLHFGGHEIVSLYTTQMRTKDMQSASKAPSQFWPGQRGFFRRLADEEHPTIHYNEEQSKEWLYFLEAQQQKVDTKIRNHLFKLIDQGKQSHSFFIIGGPGTGKTCILLNLLHFFGDIANTGIIISDELTEYIERSTNADISQYRVNSYFTDDEIDILFLDDPSSREEVEHSLDLKHRGIIRAVVIAFDPLQLS